MRPDARSSECSNGMRPAERSDRLYCFKVLIGTVAIETSERLAKLLGAQMPVLWWWALATVLTRASTTITMLAILIVGIWFYVNGQTTVGEIVMFMSFATMLIGKLEQVVHFANHMVMEGPRLQEFGPGQANGQHRRPAQGLGQGIQ